MYRKEYAIYTQITFIRCGQWRQNAVIRNYRPLSALVQIFTAMLNYIHAMFLRSVPLLYSQTRREFYDQRKDTDVQIKMIKIHPDYPRRELTCLFIFNKSIVQALIRFTVRNLWKEIRKLEITTTHNYTDPVAIKIENFRIL